MPTTVTRPRPRPQRSGSMIVAALAMAQVPRSLRALGMASVPSAPAQANAAASATPWQPTARNTTSDGAVSLGVSRSRVAASKRRSGTPSHVATALTAGSSAFRSREATQVTASGASPPATSTRLASRMSSFGAQPRSQPRPRAKTAGCSVTSATSSPGTTLRSVIRTVRRPQSPNGAPPAVSQSAEAASVTRRTGSPASSAAVTSFTRAPSPRRQPGGGAFRAKPSAVSPAVVIAARAPRATAMVRLSRFAP